MGDSLEQPTLEFSASRRELQTSTYSPKNPYELYSKLIVSPLISPIVVPYTIPYVSPFKEF